VLRDRSHRYLQREEEVELGEQIFVVGSAGTGVTPGAMVAEKDVRVRVRISPDTS